MVIKEIIAEIQHDKPISVARFMQLCLTHPRYGYYKTQQPLGKDFITSPEISQIFGETIGVWAALNYEKMGSPTAWNLVEIGAGRGTLMRDVLKVLRRFNPSIHIVEINPVLREIQQKILEGFNVTWHESLETIENCPTVQFSNELLDCLPIHQYEKHENRWHERLVGLRDNRLMMGLSAPILPPENSEGLSFKEVSQEVKPLLKALKRFPKSASLFIDYGYETGGKDTLQAMSHGAFANPLEKCGNHDLTAHVDFGALKREALQQGFKTSNIKTQRDFLVEFGGAERLNQLCLLNPSKAEMLSSGFKRVTDNTSQSSMGLLFKVLEITT